MPRVLIVGAGLLGGSIGLALRGRPGWQTAILGRNPARVADALAAGVAGEGSSDPAAVVPGCDIIVLCTPVGSIPAALESVLPWLPREACLTDIGSTKEWVCRNLQRILGKGSARFLGAHPMAGSEKSGFEYARADLFEGCTVVLTPQGEEDPHTVETIRGFWEGLGGRIQILSPADHDRIVANTSHLPHALSFVMSYYLGSLPDAADGFHGIYGRGLLDTLRLAGSDPVMWEDIIRTNRLQIADALQACKGQLEVLENWIRRGDFEQIAALMRAARELADRL